MYETLRPSVIVTQFFPLKFSSDPVMYKVLHVKLKITDRKLSSTSTTHREQNQQILLLTLTKDFGLCYRTPS